MHWLTAPQVAYQAGPDSPPVYALEGSSKRTPSSFISLLTIDSRCCRKCYQMVSLRALAILILLTTL